VTQSPMDVPRVVVGRTRRRPRRAALLVVAVLVVSLVAPLALLALLERQEVDGLDARSAPLHVLITGSDSRAGLSEEERRELTTGSAAGERTDTILVLSISGGDVGVLAFPRDLLVTRCDGTVGRINGAIGIGGPTCLVATVRAVSGLPIHHHLAITFGGFRDVVDAVGGVEVCLDRAISDRSAGIDLPAGCQRLDGVDALGYVRVRKIDSDLQRIERQQTFLRALATELIDPTLLLRPWRVIAIVRGLSGAVTVDQRFGPVGMARLAVGLRGLAAGDAVTATVPVSSATTSAGASVLRLRETEAQRLFDGFADGSALRRPASDPAS
jgi:LCP family protein required for cell wall assembly